MTRSEFEGHVEMKLPDGSVEKARIVEAEQGSTIVFNANTWQGTSENRTAERRYQPVAKVCDFLRAIMTCLSLPLSMNLLREMRSWR